MKLLFFGTPMFALPPLKLLAQEHQVVAVVTQPDKPAGRRLKTRRPPVKEFAVANNILVLQPRRLEAGSQFQRELEKLKFDAAVVAAYGRLLPRWLLSLPTYGFINIHASLLPKYRGAAPIQRALLNGERQSGVTIMAVAPELDAGEIYAQVKVDIADNDNAATLSAKLAEAGARLVIDVLEKLKAGKIKAELQDECLVTYAPKLKKEEMEIDWESDAEHIVRLVRALAPLPGAYTQFHGQRVKIIAAHVVETAATKPAKSVVAADKDLLIAAGNGVVAVDKIQPAGRKVMSGGAYILGHRLKPDEVL